MKVFVNEREVELFQGAKVKHALLKANPTLYHWVSKGKAEVRVQEDHLVDLQGAVSEGWSYLVLLKNNESTSK